MVQKGGREGRREGSGVMGIKQLLYRYMYMSWTCRAQCLMWVACDVTGKMRKCYDHPFDLSLPRMEAQKKADKANASDLLNRLQSQAKQV